MSGLHETLLVESGGPGADLLTPGRVLRALAASLGLRAEEVGALEPLGRGRVAVEVPVQRALRISTPRALPFREDGVPALFLLRRDDDAPEEGRTELTVRLADGDPAPTPGALAVAISQASGGAVSPEDLGFGFPGRGFVRLDAPDRLLLAVALPCPLSLGGRTLSLEAAGGKKNS